MLCGGALPGTFDALCAKVAWPPAGVAACGDTTNDTQSKRQRSLERLAKLRRWRTTKSAPWERRTCRRETPLPVGQAGNATRRWRRAESCAVCARNHAHRGHSAGRFLARARRTMECRSADNRFEWVPRTHRSALRTPDVGGASYWATGLGGAIATSGNMPRALGRNATTPWQGGDSQGVSGAQGQNRTADTGIFSPLLYRLSYLGPRFSQSRIETRQKTTHWKSTCPRQGRMIASPLRPESRSEIYSCVHLG